MKLIVVTSFLFICSAVAAQDLPPAANSLPPGATLQEANLSPMPNSSFPTTNRRPENSAPTLERKTAPSLPPSNSANPRIVVNSQPVRNAFPNSSFAPSGSMGEVFENASFGNAPSENTVEIRYMKKSPAHYLVARPDGTQETKTKMVYEEVTATIAIPDDADFNNLDKMELEGDGKRAAIQAITAHRHGKLLQALKDAKTEAEKEQAAKKLEDNYRAHYASETKWRLDRLAELEKRLEEMRSQVKERAAAEEKFLEAAMTLAKLNAQGIAAEPPQLKASNAPYNQGVYQAVDQPLFSNPAPAEFNRQEPSRTSSALQ